VVEEFLTDGYFFYETKQLKPSRTYPKGRRRYYLFSMIGGVKSSQGAFDRLKDLRARKRLLESQLADGTYGKTNGEDLLFLVFFRIWWETKRKTLSPGALRQYELSYRTLILPFFGKMRLGQITPQIVQQFVGSLDGLAASYLVMIYGHFRSCINAAVAQDFLGRTPCRGISLPRVRKSVKPRLEPSDAFRLIDVADFPYRALFALLAFSGVRIGEALALRRRGVDLDRLLLLIASNWDTNTRRFGLPKSDAGIRSVDILPILAEILREYFKTRQFAPDDLLFPSPDDNERPISYQTFHGVFSRALRAAGLPRVTPHSLRHTYASTLIASGVSINALQRSLGHSSPETTWNVYSHEITEGSGDGLKRADGLFRGKEE